MYTNVVFDVPFGDTPRKIEKGTIIIGATDEDTFRVPCAVTVYTRLMENGAGEKYLAYILSPKLHEEAAKEIDAIHLCLKRLASAMAPA